MVATINLNNPKSVELGMLYFKILSEEQDKEFFWKKKLREKGVKAACPANSCNEKLKTINVNYPIFNDGIEIGDKVAVGSPGNYYLVVILKVDDDSYWESYIYEKSRKRKRKI